MRSKPSESDKEKADEQFREIVSNVDNTCKACGGKGYRPGDVCSSCKGTGRVQPQPKSD